MAKDTFYFQHDYEPTSDPKMQAMIGEYKAVGYGLFWRIIEMLHSCETHKLGKKRYITIGVAKQMGVDVELFEKWLEDCINIYELFSADEESYWSDRVLRNFEKRKETSVKRSTAGTVSAERRKSATYTESRPVMKEENDYDIVEEATIIEDDTDSTSVQQTEQCVQQNSTSVEQVLTSVEQNPTKERKEKERKGNESKEEINKKNNSGEILNFEILKMDHGNVDYTFPAPLYDPGTPVPPTLETVRLYFNRLRLPEEEAIKFWLHYNSIRWKVNGVPIEWQSKAMIWKMNSNEQGKVKTFGSVKQKTKTEKTVNAAEDSLNIDLK